jgi:hypothetical protein
MAPSPLLIWLVLFLAIIGFFLIAGFVHYLRRGYWFSPPVAPDAFPDDAYGGDTSRHTGRTSISPSVVPRARVHDAALDGSGSPPAPAATSPLLPHASWWPAMQDTPDELPHVAVLAPTGAGKSTLMEALARTRGGQIVVIQPNRKRGEWEGIPVAECDDDGGYTAITAMLHAIRTEFARRGGAMKHGDPGPWLTIVWDEVPLTMRKLKDIAPDLVIDLISAGRPRKMRAILGSTSDRVGALGLEGFGDMLFSCAIIRLGAFAVQGAPVSGRAPYPTTVDVQRNVIPVERGPVLNMARMPVHPSRLWTPPAAPTTAFERDETPHVAHNDSTTPTPTDRLHGGNGTLPGTEVVVVAPGVTPDEQVRILHAALAVKQEHGRVNRSEVCRRVFNGASGGAAFNKVKAVLDVVDVEVEPARA